jgi:aminopeptidase N
MDLLGDRSMPCLHSFINGRTLGPFRVEIDERLPEGVRVGAIKNEKGTLYADVWCSFPTKEGESRLPALLLGAIQVKSYTIDTRINPDNSLAGRAELEIESRSRADRVLIFELSRMLNVSNVRDESGQKLTLIQNPSVEGSDTAARGNDWIMVVLSQPYPAGRVFRLRFDYQGNVITDVGNGVLYVGDRGSWYPNRGIASRALYDLTFQYPERLTLLATGDRIEEKTADGWKHSHWVSRHPESVAGFNLGVYDSRERKAGDLAVGVYATREVETELEKRNITLQPMTEVAGRRVGPGDAPLPLIPRPGSPLDPAALLDSVAEAAADSATFYESLYGPTPYSHLAVSQIPGHFGQGWPGLVYLPTLSFLPRADRLRLGIDSGSQEFANQLILAHEIAHQWWGNFVGWLTYRDQWLSEGFATYSAALQMAAEKDGDRKLHDLLRTYKADLLSKSPQGGTVESGGPISFGQRLSDSLNPNGYENIIYKKSCWVIHMLRTLMDDGKPEGGQRFFRMLRAFLETYRGQHPSTPDFIRTAEMHMTPAMDLDHNRRLDWFFADWVYGVGIPSYELKVSVRRAAANKFVVQGTIQQSEVPAGFEMPVPLLASYGKERRVRLGWVVVGDTGGKFRFTTSQKPTRVAIDTDNILAVVK